MIHKGKDFQRDKKLSNFILADGILFV